jgi:hypothetical protein
MGLSSLGNAFRRPALRMSARGFSCAILCASSAVTPECVLIRKPLRHLPTEGRALRVDHVRVRSCCDRLNLGVRSCRRSSFSLGRQVPCTQSCSPRNEDGSRLLCGAGRDERRARDRFSSDVFNGRRVAFPGIDGTAPRFRSGFGAAGILWKSNADVRSRLRSSP